MSDMLKANLAKLEEEDHKIEKKFRNRRAKSPETACLCVLLKYLLKIYF